MYAFLPLPKLTTCSNAYLTLSLVDLDITFLTTFVLFSFTIVLVTGSFKLFTTYGLSNIPPLIAADTAVICCIGVQ